MSDELDLNGEATEVTDREARSPGVVRCEVCKTQAFKYKCPGCQLRSCSLACSKEHKTSTGCSGKRQRTSFVPLSEFGEGHLISDYNLLEEAAQLAESAQRTRQRTSNAQSAQIAKVRHMQHQARLRNMEWRAAPPGSEARQLNSSCFDAHKRRLMWRVTWRFEGSGYCVTDEKLDEQTKLGDALAAHLKLQPGQAQRHALLKEYLEAGPEHLTLLLKQETRSDLGPSYYRLMPNHTLRLALAQKTITEFPTILVVLPRLL
ncbi:g2707 [Coccomyxa elongata]